MTSELLRAVYRPGLKEYRVGIVGAGVTGLTLARSLLQFGIDNVKIFERMPNLSDTGLRNHGMIVAPPGYSFLKAAEPFVIRELESRGGVVFNMGLRKGNGKLPIIGSRITDVADINRGEYPFLVIPRHQFVQTLYNMPLRGEPLHRKILTYTEKQNMEDAIVDKQRLLARPRKPARNKAGDLFKHAMMNPFAFRWPFNFSGIPGGKGNPDETVARIKRRLKADVDRDTSRMIGGSGDRISDDYQDFMDEFREEVERAPPVPLYTLLARVNSSQQRVVDTKGQSIINARSTVIQPRITHTPEEKIQYEVDQARDNSPAPWEYRVDTRYIITPGADYIGTNDTKLPPPYVRRITGENFTSPAAQEHKYANLSITQDGISADEWLKRRRKWERQRGGNKWVYIYSDRYEDMKGKGPKLEEKIKEMGDNLTYEQVRQLVKFHPELYTRRALRDMYKTSAKPKVASSGDSESKNGHGGQEEQERRDPLKRNDSNSNSHSHSHAPTGGSRGSFTKLGGLGNQSDKNGNTTTDRGNLNKGKNSVDDPLKVMKENNSASNNHSSIPPWPYMGDDGEMITARPPSLRKLKVEFGKNVIGTDNYKSNPHLPPHIRRIYFEDGTSDDFHLVVFADGKYSMNRMRFHPGNPNAYRPYPQDQAESKSFLVQGWTPITHVQAAVGPDRWPMYGYDEMYVHYHRGLRFMCGVTHSSPNTPCREDDLALDRLRPHVQPLCNAAAPTDYVYWRMYVPTATWTKGGFPPKGHLSTTHPQFPGPHPRDISRRLLAPDDWNPAIQHLVALADPSMMSYSIVDDVDPIPDFPFDDDPTVLFAGLAVGAPVGGAFISDSLAIEDALTLSHTIYDTMHPIPMNSMEIPLIYKDLRFERHKLVSQLALNMVEPVDIAYNGRAGTLAYQIVQELSPFNGRAFFNHLYDYAPTYPFQPLIDRIH